MDMATRPSRKPGKPRARLHECCCQYVIWNLYCQGIQVCSSSTRSSPENVSGGCQPILRPCVCVSVFTRPTCDKRFPRARPKPSIFVWQVTDAILQVIKIFFIAVYGRDQSHELGSSLMLFRLLRMLRTEVSKSLGVGTPWSHC